MNSIVERLASGCHSVIADRYISAKDFAEALQRGYVLVKFIDTNGGTELGIRIEQEFSKYDNVDFVLETGIVHLEGNFMLNFVNVRCIVDIDVKTLSGTGFLKPLQ